MARLLAHSVGLVPCSMVATPQVLWRLVFSLGLHRPARMLRSLGCTLLFLNLLPGLVGTGPPSSPTPLLPCSCLLRTTGNGTASRCVYFAMLSGTSKPEGSESPFGGSLDTVTLPVMRPLTGWPRRLPYRVLPKGSFGSALI